MRRNSWLLTGALMAAAAIFPAVPAMAGQAAQPAAASPLKRPDFSGVWQVTDLKNVVMPEVVGQMTPEAKANFEHYKKDYTAPEDDPARLCLVKGMPWPMLARARDYPFEVYQTDGRVIMMFELYDVYRNIYLDGRPKPENYPESPNGWSTAHWEGDTLVVETTGIAPLNPIGPNLRGNGAKITERWSLQQDPAYGEVLVVDMLQDDPEVYVTPARGRNMFKRAAPGTVVGGYNCSSALWDEHVDKREAELNATKK